jgi:hypothetical protein
MVLKVVHRFDSCEKLGPGGGADVCHGRGVTKKSRAVSRVGRSMSQANVETALTRFATGTLCSSRDF